MEPTETTLVWKGEELPTMGDITRALYALESREEAREFMQVYLEVNPYAFQNVGYMAGYMNREDADRIYDWCQTSHPIFGTTHPSAEQAFALGQRMAEAPRKDGHTK